MSIETREQIKEAFSQLPNQVSSLRRKIEETGKNVQNRLEDRATDVQNRVEESAQNLQLKFRQTQSTSVIGFFRLQKRATQGLHDAIEKLPAQLAEPLMKEWNRTEEKIRTQRLQEWDELNARTAIKKSRELGLLDALFARAYEAENKNRKTVLAALDQRIDRHQDGQV